MEASKLCRLHAPACLLTIMSLVAACTSGTQINRLNNALLLACVHYLKCSALRLRKTEQRSSFLPTDLVHVSGHIVTPDAFSFSAAQLGKLVSRFVCISETCQFYVLCLDELLKLYFARISQYFKIVRDEYVAFFSFLVF